MMRTLLLLFLGLTVQLSAQKTVHIPLYLQNPNDVNGAQFSWSKTAQSANFILIWGNTVGTNPANYPNPDLAFAPAKILDTMEYIYAGFKALGFLDDSPGTNLAQYKLPIVMYGTWGANGAQGWANGGDADGIIGAFWAHPNAMRDGGVAAHEFAHSLQAQNNIDYRADNGLGYSWLNTGIFWETHANFMRNLLYPQAVSAWGMDVYHLETWGDWKNTYENYALLFGIMEMEGIDMVNRLWRESYSGEYPLQAYKRLAGYAQAQFNDSLFQYARRMATYDFNYNNVGSFFRQYRNTDLNNWLPSVQNCYSILRQVPGGDPGRYEIPIEQAPEEFAYNIIPLYPNADSCSVIVKFKGHTEVNTHTGWRYGFVAAKANGTVSRYSPIYSANTAEVAFRLQGTETKMYLVVMGAPRDGITTNTSNDTWHGYPKHFRFPYEVKISGAVPEGHQPAANFRTAFRTNGHLHSNGGGWVQNSATVAGSVYVGPMAMVLGNANISGTVRIEGTSIVRNATMSGNVRVLGNAVVDRGTYSQNARVQGNAFVTNATMSGGALVGMRARVDNYVLSGTVEIGGDVVVYNDQGNCNNSVHYRLTNYYDNKFLECDGRTANHPANSDVNNTYGLFSNAEMAQQCQCAGVNEVIVDSIDIEKPNCTNLASGGVQFHISSNCGPFTYTWSKGNETGSNLDGLSPGAYSFTITDALDRNGIVFVEILPPPALTGSVLTTPFDCGSLSGGTAKVEITSGTTPFQYAWTNGATSDAISNLVPAEYAVTVTDALGCTYSTIADIQLAGQMNANLDVTSIDCTGSAGGGAISIINVGGTAPFSYQWSNGEATATVIDLPPGTYSITATDAFGCSFTGSAEVAVTGQLGLQLSANPISCAGGGDGSAAVSPQGGTAPFTWFWEDGQTDSLHLNLGAGTYAITVIDASGCIGDLQFTLTEPDPLDLQIAQANPACFGSADGSATASAIGGTPGYTFLWSNGNTAAEASGLVSGDYTVTVTDANGCFSSAVATLASPPVLTLETPAQNVSCFGMADGMATAMVGGGTPGYVYLWSNGMTDATIASLAAGNYAVTIMDANGCTVTAAAPIGSPAALEVEITQTPVLFCQAETGDITVVANGGTSPYGYLWENGATEATIVGQAGSYTVTVTDANGCTQIRTDEVESAMFSDSNQVNNASSATTADGAIYLVNTSGGTPPLSFHWSNDSTTQQIEQLLPGEYTVTITDAAGCQWEYAFTVGFEVSTTSDKVLNIQSLIIPNPSSSYATLMLDLPEAQDLTVTVADALGRELLMEKTRFQTGKNNFMLPQGLAAGVYRVMVRAVDGKFKTMKWVVE